MRTPAPRTRALAGKLRPFVAELAGTARPTGGHAGDDRVARAGQAVRLGSAPRSYPRIARVPARSEEHTSELQSRFELVCRLLLEKKKERSTREVKLPYYG